MVHISRCPLCNEHVSVPDGLAEQAQVRCPLCEREFPLSEVGEPDGGAGDLAPELVPVADVQDEGPMLDIWKNPQELVDEVPEIRLGSVLRKPEGKKTPTKKETKPVAASSAPAIDFGALHGDEPAEEPVEAGTAGPSESAGDRLDAAAEPFGAEEPDDLPKIKLADTESPVLEAGGAGEAPAAEADVPSKSDGAEESTAAYDENAEGSIEEHRPEPEQRSTEAAAIDAEPPAAETPEVEASAAEVAETGESPEMAAPVDAQAGESEPGSQAEEPVEPKEEPNVVLRCPHCEAESKLTELILASSGEPVDVATLAAALGLVSAGQAEAGPKLSVWGEPVSAAPPIDFGQGVNAGAEEVHEGAFSFASGPEGENASSSTAARTRRRKGEKSIVKEMIGAAFGAVLAVPIAYYLLNLIGGERFDKVPIPLPFCPHTYDHLPSDWPGWWPGWARFSSSSEEPESDELGIAFDATQIEEAIGQPDETRQEFPSAGEPAVPTGLAAPAAQEPPSRVETQSPVNQKAAPKAGTATPDKKSARAGEKGRTTKGEAAKPANRESQASDAITPEAYQKLRRIAEAITVVDGEPEADVAGKVDAVRGVLRKAASDPESFDTIGKLAGDAWKQLDAGQPGILLAGTVQQVGSHGKGRSAEIELAANGGTVPVASNQPLEVAEGDRVLVLGTIVSGAGKKLADYDLPQSKVVWAGLTLKLGE